MCVLELGKTLIFVWLWSIMPAFPLFVCRSCSNPVSGGVETELLPHHRDAGGCGAGVSRGGGAHVQPFLRATGPLCRLLRRREP